MIKEMKKKSLIFGIPNIIFLFLTISSISTSKGRLSYLCAILCILFFLAFIMMSVHVYKKDYKKFLKDFCGFHRNSLFDLLLSIVGLIISYSINRSDWIIFWCFFLVSSIINIPFPKKKSIDK